MSIYRFSAKSPVQEVIFRHANDRSPVALLTASDSTPADQLSTIRRAMGSGNWTCVPVTLDSHEYLQVSGFEKEAQLLSFLQKYHFAEGQPQFSAEPGDNPRRCASEWLQDYGLKAAGYLNIIGDASLLGSGLVSGRSKEITSGALYTAGAAVLARYGNAKTEVHVREVLEDTVGYLKKQAVALPEDCGLFSIMKEKRDGLLPSAERFMTRYPTEVMLGAYTLGAFTMLQSGIRERNPWGIAYGASSVGLKASSLLIPEKSATDTQKNTPHGPLGSLVSWIQEKPLRVYGFGSMVNNVLLGLSAYREYKTNPKQMGYIFKFITTGTYMVGDLLIALSNKDHTNADGKFDTEEQRRVVAMVAEALSRQPKNMQQPLVNNVAGFLAHQAEMNGNAMDIANSIREQLDHMATNPWSARSALRADPGVVPSPAQFR